MVARHGVVRLLWIAWLHVLAVSGLDTTGSVVYCWSDAAPSSTYIGAQCGFETLLLVPNGEPRQPLQGIAFTAKYVGPSALGFDLAQIQFSRRNQSEAPAQIADSYIGLFLSNETTSQGDTVPSALPYLAVSSPVRKNVTAVGATSLAPPEPLLLPDRAGSLIVLARFSVANLQGSFFHFATFRSIDVQYPIPTRFPVTYDATSTYCWATDQVAYDRLVNRDDSAGFSADCPIALNVTSPLAAQSLSPIPIAWSLHVRAEYAGGMRISPTSVLHTAVHLCSNVDDGYCHVFNQKPYVASSQDLAGNISESSQSASFATTLLSLPTGLYLGLHMSSCAVWTGDMCTWPRTFSSNTTYCWKLFAPTAIHDVDATSMLGTHSTGSSCPVAITLRGLDATPALNASTLVAWQVTPDISAASHLVDLPANWSVAWSRVVTCTAPCSPFSGSKPLATSPFTPSNGTTAATLRWTAPGSYVVYAWATLNTLQGTRLDVATFQTITIAAPLGASSLSTTTIVLIASTSVVAIALFSLLGVSYYKQRQHKRMLWTQWQLSRAGLYSYGGSPCPIASQHSDIPIMQGAVMDTSRIAVHDSFSEAHDDDEKNARRHNVDLQYLQENRIEYPIHRGRIASNATGYYVDMDPTRPTRTKSSVSTRRDRNSSSAILFDPTRQVRATSNPISAYDPTRDRNASIASNHQMMVGPRPLYNGHAPESPRPSSVASTGSIMATYGHSMYAMQGSRPS
ncbi:hypothetical protein SPRG_04739 [Saprolegnia parasitica CBS 223.65]|uniref:Membrane-associated protein n=1 Tax=Saprolegnia parasitica (strain CBS 223.65) TaxID=695850 RepID=A0A067CK11_SAPPC|nr:hypothetical protein SPRG_04739 [Saprolegnia parasitica CBS 223.65]KDO30838.1 hypothetical protein SPRG_04739 [Saprolegnia parasitica CBS 223.65]|eukprot:XP_012198535.1 hypothetical protein SPRG_04739 [Saprolegnia parasitica CBS 223.65]